MRSLKALMNNPRLLRLAYSPKIVLPLSRMGITRTLRNLHYRSTVGSNKKYETSVGKQRVVFSVPDPSDLVHVEYDLTSYEAQTLRVVTEALRPGDVFVDVGADVGMYSIPSALTVGPKGRVIAFEPQGKSLARLQENLALNQLSNVRTFKVALGEKSQQAHLYGHGTVASLSSSEAESNPDTQWEEVDVAAGDDFWTLHSLPHPQVVKVDVEGFEYSVLRGFRRTLSLPATNLLVCEVHPLKLPNQISTDAIQELVASFGFSEIKLVSRNREIHMVARKTH